MVSPGCSIFLTVYYDAGYPMDLPGERRDTFPDLQLRISAFTIQQLLPVEQTADAGHRSDRLGLTRNRDGSSIGCEWKQCTGRLRKNTCFVSGSVDIVVALETAGYWTTKTNGVQLEPTECRRT